MSLAPFLLSILLATNGKDPGRFLLEVKARELLTNFVAGRFEAASKDFNDSLRVTVPPSTLSNLSREIAAKVGEFQQVTEAHQLEDDGFQTIELIAKYERSPVAVRVVFDASNRVGAVYMSPIVQAVDPKLEAAARELHANFESGHFELIAGRFNEVMRTQLPPAKLAELHKQVEDVFGSFQSISGVREIADHDYKVIDLITSYENSPIFFRVVFDRASRIAGLKIGTFKP